jgi:putative FmdB family regulatory protein
MPIYEYNCEKCGVVEVLQRITEAPLKRCPKCKRPVERLVSRSSFILKGSGWYATDYGRKGTSSPPESTHSNGANGSHVTPATEASSTTADGSSAKSSPAGSDKTPPKSAD